MQRLASFALTLALALPACAQRGGGHAGFASHGASSFRSAPTFRGAPAFRGSFAPSTAFRYAGGPLVRPSYAAPFARSISPALAYAPRVSTARPSFYQRYRAFPDHRRFARYPAVAVYPYPVNSFAFWPYGDLDDIDDQGLPAQPDNGLAAYPAPYPAESAPPPAEAEPYYPQPAAPYAPEYAPPPPAAPATAQPQPVPEPEEAVTLIFKNGHPSEQIHNYLATRSTITVIDGRRHRDIPIADLDLPATIKANHDAGVDFQLPTGQ